MKMMKVKLIYSLLFLLIVVNVRAQDSLFTNSFGMQFVLIQPGSMVVGKFQPVVSPLNFNGKPLPEKMVSTAQQLALKDHKPGFKVNIKHAYLIGRYEITQEQWTKVMGSNPSTFKNDSSANQPVETIKWSDAQAFIRKLNALDQKHRYRLPSEFEWEYAARAGAHDDIPWKEIQATAVLGGEMPKAIGTKKPNAWGLYDMLGNVWEWVQDFYNEKMFADPTPPKSGKEHVLKGSSFTGDVKNATYMTHAAGPGNRFDIGLRLLMEAKR